MKRFVFLSILVLTITLSFTKKAFISPGSSLQQAQPNVPKCGLDLVIANMTPEMRKQIANPTTTAIPAREILVYLDFDGAMIRWGEPRPTVENSGLSSQYFSSLASESARSAGATALNTSQITDITKLVADDFSPFNIRVTTDLQTYKNYSPAEKKLVCIITGDRGSLGMGGVGGIAPWRGQGVLNPYNPSFVFSYALNNNVGHIASVISHEVGHTLGLGHQPIPLPNTAPPCVSRHYHPGLGSGPLGFVPIMGSGSQRVSNWFSQPCRDEFVSLPQNDFDFIKLQVYTKNDDFPNQFIKAQRLNPFSNRTPIVGILGEKDKQGNLDVDFLKFELFDFAYNFNISSENADLRVSLLDNTGGAIGIYNDSSDTGVRFPVAKKGIYYLKIEAASNVNMEAQYMTGMYKIEY